MATPIQPAVQEQTMAMYDNGSQQMEMEGSAVMTEQYDDNYAEEYEYGDQSYDSGGQLETQGATGAGEKRCLVNRRK